MDDTIVAQPNFPCLFGVASEQHGYFSTAQAGACGFDRSLVAHHAKTGRFVRFYRGVYRLRDYPSFEREEVVAAWLAVGKESSVVSHESALELLDLSDVIPNSTHLTVLRARRRRFPKLPGVTIHTTVRPLRPVDLTTREGIRLTSAVRSILDAAEAGTDPGQIERATHQAIGRGLTTVEQLVEDARARSQRLLGLIEIAVRRPS